MREMSELRRSSLQAEHDKQTAGFAFQVLQEDVLVADVPWTPPKLAHTKELDVHPALTKSTT